MKWNTLALADVAPSPWKNGGGVTRELLALPSPAHWVFRLSVAEVQADGPFSRFEGVQRWFAVLSGAGVRLRLGKGGAGEVHALTRSSAPFCFDGALPVDCALINGATQDFNLMLRADQASAHMLRVVDRLNAETAGPRTVAVWAGGAGAEVWTGQACTRLAAHSLVWQALPAGVALNVLSTDALYMEIDA